MRCRYGRNWLKVRALGLTQYHSILLVDSDVAVAGPLASVFGLPVEFAAVWDQSKWLNRCACVCVCVCVYVVVVVVVYVCLGSEQQVRGPPAVARVRAGCG